MAHMAASRTRTAAKARYAGKVDAVHIIQRYVKQMTALVLQYI